MDNKKNKKNTTKWLIILAIIIFFIVGTIWSIAYFLQTKKVEEILWLDKDNDISNFWKNIYDEYINEFNSKYEKIPNLNEIGIYENEWVFLNNDNKIQTYYQTGIAFNNWDINCNSKKYYCSMKDSKECVKHQLEMVFEAFNSNNKRHLKAPKK